jgi:putative acetyltransferase
MQTLNIIEVDPRDKQVAELVAVLDAYQIDLYGADCCHLDSAEELISANALMLASIDDNGEVHGVGAIKFHSAYAEIKRVYYKPEWRGTGEATRLIRALEAHAFKKGVFTIKLETGVAQLAAIRAYEKLGYQRCEAFACYENNHVSVFMQKQLATNSTTAADSDY